MRIESGDESPAQVGGVFSPPALSEYVVEVADFRESVGAAAVSNALETLIVNEPRSQNNLTQSTLSSLVITSRKYIQSSEKDNCLFKKEGLDHRS